MLHLSVVGLRNCGIYFKDGPGIREMFLKEFSMNFLTAYCRDETELSHVLHKGVSVLVRYMSAMGESNRRLREGLFESI